MDEAKQTSNRNDEEYDLYALHCLRNNRLPHIERLQIPNEIHVEYLLLSVTLLATDVNNAILATGQ